MKRPCDTFLTYKSETSYQGADRVSTLVFGESQHLLYFNSKTEERSVYFCVCMRVCECECCVC